MLIDVHAHLLTRGMFNRDPNWGPFMTAAGFKVGPITLGSKQPATAANDQQAEARLLSRMTHQARVAVMDQRGVDRMLVATPSHAFLYWAGEFGTEYARVCNDELSAYCRVMPDRFDFWAHANLANPAAAVAEIDRAVRQLGARGVCVGGTNFGGIETHDERLFPVWEKIAELDVPIMVHGFSQASNWGDRHGDDKFETTSILGDCFDETLFFWYLICGGALDAFPALKVYVTHAGGMAVFQLGRLADLNASLAHDARNARPLMDYLSNFYFDLDVHHPALRRAVAEVIGADRLLYGTNFGAVDAGDLTAGIGLSDADREKIRSGNAVKLLKLDRPATTTAAAA